MSCGPDDADACKEHRLLTKREKGRLGLLSGYTSVEGSRSEQFVDDHIGDRIGHLELVFGHAHNYRRVRRLSATVLCEGEATQAVAGMIIVWRFPRLIPQSAGAVCLTTAGPYACLRLHDARLCGSIAAMRRSP